MDTNTESPVPPDNTAGPAPPCPQIVRMAPLWDGGRALLAFLLLALVSLLLGLLFVDLLGFYWSVALSELLAFGALPYLISRWFDTGWSRWMKRARVAAAFWGWAVVAVVSFAVVESNLPVLFDRIWPIPPSQFEVYRRYLAASSPGELLLLLVVAALIPGIFEEITFRGLIQSGLKRSFGARPAIVWSGFLFALLHLNPWNFVGLWVFGCLLGYLVERTGSIWPAVFVHIINNSIALVVFASQSPAEWEHPLEVLPWYLTGASGFVLILALWRLHQIPIRGADEPASAEAESISRGQPFDEWRG